MWLTNVLMSSLRRSSRKRIPGHLFMGKIRLWPKAKPWEMKYYFEDAMREQRNIRLLQTPFITKEQEEIYESCIGYAIKEDARLQRLEKLAKSKYLTDLSCYELVHTTDPSCMKSWLLMAYYTGLNSFKLYAPLYLLSGMLSGRPVAYLKTKFLWETLQSTAFAIASTTSVLASACITVRLVGEVNLKWHFLAGVLSQYISIGIERTSKRSSLTASACMIAAEGLFNALKDRGYVRGIPKGEVVLLAVALFCLSSFAPLTFERGEQPDTASFIMKLFCSVPRNERWRHLLSRVKEPGNPRNKNHAHPDDMSCLTYVVDGVIRGGLAGLALDIFSMIIGRYKNSEHDTSGFAKLFSSSSLRFSLLFFVFRTLLCSSAKLLPNLDAVLRRSLAVFISSFVFALSKMGPTIPLWLFFKAAQVTCGKMAGGMSPVASDQVTKLVYALSLTYVIYQGCMEPHNMKHSRWQLLLKMTGNLFAYINRKLLAGLNAGADRMDPLIHGCPNWWPRYDPAVTSQWTGPTAIPSFILAETTRRN